MYKYIKDVDSSNRADVILRVADNAWVPNDMKNSDWKIYQTWLGQGNTPLAAS